MHTLILHTVHTTHARYCRNSLGSMFPNLTVTGINAVGKMNDGFEVERGKKFRMRGFEVKRAA